MVSKTFVFIFVCVGLFVMIQTLLPKALALKRTSNIDEFTVEDKRTRTRHNYVVQRALDKELMNDYDYVGPKYTIDSVPTRAETEELPEFIVDYANMIRNDIILLDNSVETRTRKRGNIKVKKQHSGHEVSDPPCDCEKKNEIEFFDLSSTLGGTVYPQIVRNLTCDASKCARHYKCVQSTYNITVLKKKSNNEIRDNLLMDKHEYERMPEELKNKWFPYTIPVITGCLCIRSREV